MFILCIKDTIVKVCCASFGEILIPNSFTHHPIYHKCPGTQYQFFLFAENQGLELHLQQNRCISLWGSGFPNKIVLSALLFDNLLFIHVYHKGQLPYQKGLGRVPQTPHIRTTGTCTCMYGVPFIHNKLIPFNYKLKGKITHLNNILMSQVLQ